MVPEDRVRRLLLSLGRYSVTVTITGCAFTVCRLARSNPSTRTVYSPGLLRSHHLLIKSRSFLFNDSPGLSDTPINLPRHSHGLALGSPSFVKGTGAPFESRTRIL